MRRKQALFLQNIGMLLIVTVMAADRFWFAVPEEMILLCAVISSILLITAIYLKKKDELDADRQSTGRPE